MTLKVGLFWLFNTIVPFTDVGTDLFTFFDLLRDGHIMWAILTFAVMWNPFFIHLGVFTFDLLRRKGFDAKKKAGQVFIHLPFVLPFKNLYNTAYLGHLRFGGSNFEDSSWAEVEQIQHEAGIAGMYESFTEAGPQSVVQLGVILCTGKISPAQFFSIPSSVFSLSWASSRAYFIQRGQDESDPDPDLKIVLMHIFPWKLVIVLNSVILWTLIGGLMGVYIFIGIPACFATILLALFILEKVIGKEEQDAVLEQIKGDYLVDNGNIEVEDDDVDETESNDVKIVKDESTEEANRPAEEIIEIEEVYRPEETKKGDPTNEEGGINVVQTEEGEHIRKNDPQTDHIISIEEKKSNDITVEESKRLNEEKSKTLSEIEQPMPTEPEAEYPQKDPKEKRQLTYEKVMNKVLGTSTVYQSNQDDRMSKDMQVASTLVPESNETEITKDNSEYHFKLISATTSIWLPCVVGSMRNMFLTSALVSLASKVLMLAAAVLLTYFRVIETNVFLLWCYDIPTAEAKVREHNSYSDQLWSLEICREPSDDTYPPCYGSEDSRLSQKIRICAPPATENIFRLVLLLVVFVSTIASCMAAYNLHKMSNYYILWKRTTSFCFGCIPTQPVAHRSLVFALAGDNTNHEDLAHFLGVNTQPLPANFSPPPPTEMQIQTVNRARRGETPLHQAAKMGAIQCIWVLRRAGAKLKRDGNGRKPYTVKGFKEMFRNFYESRGMVTQFSMLTLLRT